MPVGYLVTAGGLAIVSLLAVARRRPRNSSPFRLSYVFGLWLNWPSLVLLFLLASTALALGQNGLSAGSSTGLALAVVASAGLLVLRRRARETGPALEHALDEGLGEGWRDGENAARLRGRPSLGPVLFAPVRREGVERAANISYGPAPRGNLLDVYRRPSDRSGCPTLVYLHGGAFRIGSKRLGARYMFQRLASHGWVCVSANYRLGRAGSFPNSLIDVKRAIAWVREHHEEYGVDPDAVFLAGSSSGGHLASMAALTPGDPIFQPGFEGADTSVAGAISLYGYYGPVASGEPSSPCDHLTPTAPPFLVAHGDQDTLVLVDDARSFAGRLRAISTNPVVYVELPGAQHGFDLFRSRRLETIIDAIEAFADRVTRGRGSSSPELRHDDRAARRSP